MLILSLVNIYLQNLYAGQETTVRTEHGTTDWFKTGKEVKGCMLSPCLLNLYAEYTMQNDGLDEAQSRFQGEILINSDIQMILPLQQKAKRN